MKTFIFTIEKEKISRINGGADVTAGVYRIKNNIPCKVGVVQWCTRGYMGEYSEVTSFLVAKKEIPVSWTDKGGYYPGPNNGKFKLYQV